MFAFFHQRMSLSANERLFFQRHQFVRHEPAPPSLLILSHSRSIDQGKIREVNESENSDFLLMLNQAVGDRAILAKQLNISAAPKTVPFKTEKPVTARITGF
jgi:hypothetical protein